MIEQGIEADKNHLTLLKKIDEFKDVLNIKKPETERLFGKLLTQHATVVNAHLDNRAEIIQAMIKYVLGKDADQGIQIFLNKKEILFNDYMTKVENLEAKKVKGNLTEFFALNNGYRNALNKELNPLEAYTLYQIRNTDMGKQNHDLREVLLKYEKYKKDFSDADKPVRKRLSEVLNESKK